MGPRVPGVRSPSGPAAGLTLHRPPPTSAQLIHRDRVLAELRATAHARVICLQAPGGYGKTTAVSQWLDQEARPIVWVRVPRAAPDAAWVAQAIVDGLHEAQLVEERLTLTGSPGHTTWHLSTLPLIESLLADISRPFVVVVDDAGAVTGTAWDCLVESLAVSLPKGAQVVLTTRGALPTPLWRLQSRGEAAVLGREVLAFDETEARALMAALGVRPTNDQVQVLMRQTEGWPVAVYLESQRLGAGPVPAPTDDATLGTGLAQYLRADIIGTLSEEDARFLARISVLDVLDEEACDTVAGTTGSLERLRRLASANNLLTAQDRAAERFRLHPLLAEALEQQFHEEDPAARRSAHASAGRVAASHGNLDGAVHHAKVAHDDGWLSELIWSAAASLLATGRFAVLRRWLDGLDDQRISRHCGLAMSAAWLAAQEGDIPRMHRMSLISAQRAAEDDPGCALDAGLLAATIGADGLARIETVTRSFVAARPVDDPWQSLAYFLLGVALHLRDEPREAIVALEESGRIAMAHDLPLMQAHALAGLADVAFEEGDDRRALSLVREARALAAQHRLDAITTTGPVFTTSAIAFVHEGRFADAKREATRALRLTAGMRWVAPWHAVQGRLALAQVFSALGDPERAKVLADEADDAHGHATASPRLDRLAAQTRARLSAVSASLGGSSSLTTAEIRVLQYLPTHLTFSQIADELFVSRHTVKTQALSTYRKLGVHTRTEAIASARRAGLLPPG